MKKTTSLILVVLCFAGCVTIPPVTVNIPDQKPIVINPVPAPSVTPEPVVVTAVLVLSPLAASGDVEAANTWSESFWSLIA